MRQIGAKYVRHQPLSVLKRKVRDVK